MSDEIKSSWHAGYQETKNLIHNEMGITKEDITDIFKQMGKDEIHEILSENRSFVYSVIREVIRHEMILAVTVDKYKTGRWFNTKEIDFKEFIKNMMKEEISNLLKEQFDFSFEITKKE